MELKGITALTASPSVNVTQTRDRGPPHPRFGSSLITGARGILRDHAVGSNERRYESLIAIQELKAPADHSKKGCNKTNRLIYLWLRPVRPYGNGKDKRIAAYRETLCRMHTTNLSEIQESLDGVVKVNVDTDMQYAFTGAVAGRMFKNYDSVLKVDGEVGNKKVYDPRSYLAIVETAMAERVKQAASDLRASGKTTFAS